MSIPSKNIPKMVPWLDAAEWSETRDLLFSEEVEDIHEGIFRAKIWIERGKVPTAVESTVNFLEIILNDTEFLPEFMKGRSEYLCDFDDDESACEMDENEDSHDMEQDEVEVEQEDNNTLDHVSGINTVSDRILRLSYNTAVIRFVNELVDTAQKSLFATSITKLADQIGLPRVFVDIRHDGTHDKMATLELLRWAAGLALKWLEDQYWNAQQTSDVEEEAKFKEFVGKTVDVYCEQLEKVSEMQPMFLLEKSSVSRVINQVEYLQTLPRVMKSFLLALSEYRRPALKISVIESIIRPLARNNSQLFFKAFSEIHFISSKKSDITASWLPWTIDELVKLNDVSLMKDFISSMFSEFASKSSLELFKEKLVPFWDQIQNMKNIPVPVEIYSVFESLYSPKHDNGVGERVGRCVGFDRRKSEDLVNKYKFKEDYQMAEWCQIDENWRTCPFGSIPN